MMIVFKCVISVSKHTHVTVWPSSPDISETLSSPQTETELIKNNLPFLPSKTLAPTTLTFCLCVSMILITLGSLLSGIIQNLFI